VQRKAEEDCPRRFVPFDEALQLLYGLVEDEELEIPEEE
jgi:hypothetical protein